MTLLSIIQKTSSRLGLRRPTAVIGSTDITAQTLLELANEEGDELSRAHDWQDLIVERAVSTVGQVEQTTALPIDYDRFPHNVEIWNRTHNQRYAGPTPQRLWQQLQQGVSAGAVGWWRILGGSLHIYPAPTAGEDLAFEYLTKNWCAKADGTGQSEWLADTDVCLLPERLFVLGVRWRWKAAKGLAYAEDMETYQRAVELAATNDRGTGRIRGGQSDFLVSPNWNGTIET